jgi:hypothetical protein
MVDIQDPLENIGFLLMNHLFPPFKRRAGAARDPHGHEPGRPSSCQPGAPELLCDIFASITRSNGSARKQFY